MKRLIYTVAVAAGLLALGSSNSLFAQSFPQWRGPDGQGHTAAKNLPVKWSEQESVAWKTEIPGRGYSSPVIAGGAIWMTTAIETEASEAEKEERLKTNTGNQPLTVLSQAVFRAVCVDLKTGKLLHDVELFAVKDPQWVHQLNSYASPTPILSDGRLYCHFGTNGTACLDTAAQKVLWVNRELKIHHENGPGSTPILWKNLLIVHCDGSDKQYVAALDANTGKIAWKTKRSGEMRSNPQLRKAYGTPLVIKIDGREQLVSPGADWLYGYDPATGEELWKLGYGVLGFSIVPRPVYGNGLLIFSTSFMKPEIISVRLDGGKPEIAWRYKRQAPKIPSPLLVGDELYFVSDIGIATCLDAKTGEAHWTERLEGNYAASPMYGDGKIYFCNREGLCTVVKPGRQFHVLAKNELDSGFMASPAAVDGSLILRTTKALYRIGKE